MIKLGLKLWSINDNYIEEAVKLYEQDIYQYIELYAFPDTFKKTISWWKDLQIPFIIHAPHFMHGMNLSIKADESANIVLAKEAFNFADALNADKVIFHPGCEGNINETIRQIRLLNDKRIVIENKPCQSIDGKFRCVGSSVEEIKMVIEETGSGFCLDIGHAIYSANSNGNNPISMINSLNKLEPVMYHIVDGDYSGVVDLHYNIGKGTFPFYEIFKSIKTKNIFYTIETKKNSISDLNDFIKDCNNIKQFIVN